MYQVDKIISLLSSFSASPANVLSKRDKNSKGLQQGFLILSIVFFLILLVLAVVQQLSPLPTYLRTMALISGLLAQVFALLMLMTDIVVGMATLMMWKKHTLEAFLREIKQNEKHATQLMAFHEDELQYAQFWLEKKISRNESRLKLFFGDKTAAIALLGLCWPVVKEIGGLENLPVIFSHFMVPGNMLDTFIWVILAVLLGFSLGGIMLKNINERYSYQVSLIELTQKLKAMKEKKEISQALP